ncbi:MAG: oligosaccharide flippase family protein, partial [Acholeplasmataceae bacterium]
MSVTKNFIYNIIYQLLIVLIPIILIPYVSNTLKTEGVGIYTYSFSIVTYFSQFALFGVYFYGTKKISQVKEDLFLLKKTFWEIFYLKLIFTVISISIYFTFT